MGTFGVERESDDPFCPSIVLYIELSIGYRRPGNQYGGWELSIKLQDRTLSNRIMKNDICR